MTLKNWATPWTNEEGDVFAPLNDYTAMVIGLIRDGDSGADFRTLLSSDNFYVGANSLGLTGYSRSNNDHYEELEAGDFNLGDLAVLVSRPQTSNGPMTDDRGVAGIFSTRAAARAFFYLGSNRAMLRFALKDHLCNDMEQLLDVDRPTNRIRQDVSRSPGGDSRVYLSNCMGCHNGMDPLVQAFAYYEYEFTEGNEDGGQLVYTHGVVQDKYFNNDKTFEPGYRTPDDRWTNHWRQGANVELLGWTTTIPGGAIYTEGYGAKTMGQELASSDAFASCQVKKAFRHVCLREPAEADRNVSNGIEDIVAGFKVDGNMKQVFAEVAAYCDSDL